MSQPQPRKTCPTCGRVQPENLWDKIFSDYRYTLLAFILIAFLSFFLWSVFDHQGFVTAINTFATAMTVIAAVVVVVGIAVMVIRYALSPNKKKGSH